MTLHRKQWMNASYWHWRCHFGNITKHDTKVTVCAMFWYVKMTLTRNIIIISTWNCPLSQKTLPIHNGVDNKILNLEENNRYFLLVSMIYTSALFLSVSSFTILISLEAVIMNLEFYHSDKRMWSKLRLPSIIMQPWLWPDDIDVIVIRCDYGSFF